MRKGQKHSSATKHKIGERNSKHGHAKGSKPSPTYLSWRAMLLRCYNHGSPSYPYYGALGTTVCSRWRASFADFLADLGPRPPGTTLDRFPKRHGNYKPGNCRWATEIEQTRNRDDVKLTLDLARKIMGYLERGEIQRSIAARFGVSRSLVGHIKRGQIWKELPPFQGKLRKSRADVTVDVANKIKGRLEHGESQQAVATRFGVSQSLVSCIKRAVWRGARSQR